jgi:GT2 family glycosyltransferase
MVLFTDDDVDLAPDWIEKMLAAAHDNPSCDVFTGKIVGKWEIEPPEDLKSWIPMGSTFAVHERETSGDCDPGMVWGPNMAYRRKVFDGGIRFNEKIGPTPAAFYAMGEDSEMAQRAAEKGHKVFYAADAVVIHTIKAATVNEDWVIRRAERLGYGRFVIEPNNPHTRIFPTWVPMGAEVTFRFLFWAALYPLTFLMPRSERRFWTRWGFYYYRGLFKSWRDYAA